MFHITANVGEKGSSSDTKSLDLNHKSNYDLIASTTSLSSSITLELPIKSNSSNDLSLLNDDFRNNKLINKEKQDWIQNYLDDNDKQLQKEQQEMKEHSEHVIKNDDGQTKKVESASLIVNNNDYDDDVGTSVDDIESKEGGKGEEELKRNKNEDLTKNQGDNEKKDFQDFVKIDNLSGNSSSNR